MYIVYLSITINERKVMIDKVIDVLGYLLIIFLVAYAVYFYGAELIRIIS